MPARRHNSSTSFTTKAVVSASQGSLAWLDLLTHLHISLAAGLLAQPCNLARATAFVGSSAFSGLWGRRLFSLKVGIIVPFSLPRQNTLLQHAMPRPGHLDSSRTCVANCVGAWRSACSCSSCPSFGPQRHWFILALALGSPPRRPPLHAVFLTSASACSLLPHQLNVGPLSVRLLGFALGAVWSDNLPLLRPSRHLRLLGFSRQALGWRYPATCADDSLRMVCSTLRGQ